MKTYGVIDIGSNTIRLVLYKWENQELTALLNNKNVAGLAGYIKKDNHLSHAGVEKAVCALSEFKEIIEKMGIEEVHVFATASLRNITNTEEVVNRIYEKTGFRVHVITGEEEATLDYMGALHKTSVNDGLLIDIGGGSTEFVHFRERKLLTAKSIRIGSLNLFSKYVEEIIPGKKETKKMTSKVIEELEACDFLKQNELPDTLCGVGGTARATLKMIQAKYPEDIEADGSYSADTLHKLFSLFEEDRSSFIKLALRNVPDRSHTILPGLIILKNIVEYCGVKKIVTSPYGVREGYLYSVLKGEEKTKDESNNG
ncbi:MAG: exopolyphosphatase / guanosine-5-triphosphate,3-diphosphate pyrophosphatase [Clostridiales bacterium]|nr:exopolyphosphatase / guanosine-5-triphosphate,3-diphosphate pyrophosphatase [Clostridiales bacterium]